MAINNSQTLKSLFLELRVEKVFIIYLVKATEFSTLSKMNNSNVVMCRVTKLQETMPN
jgi:hypothetical protein